MINGEPIWGREGKSESISNKMGLGLLGKYNMALPGQGMSQRGRSDSGEANQGLGEKRSVEAQKGDMFEKKGKEQ